MLLGRFDVDPNTDDDDGQPPLWNAAGHWYEGVVELLLERNDINPNTTNSRSPGHSREPPIRDMQEG